MHVRMIQDFHVDQKKTGSFLTYPAGWVGDAPDDHAKKAIKVGAAERSVTFTPARPAPSSPAASRPASAGEPGSPIDLDSLTDDQLAGLAVEHEIDVSAASTRADMIALLRAA